MNYTQTWAAGVASPPMQEAGWNPSGSDPGGNATYPYAVYADEVDLNGDGELTHWSGGAGDFSVCQWWEALFGDLGDGSWNAQHGKFEYVVDVSAAALDDNTYAPAFLQSTDASGTYNNAIGCSLFQDSGSTWGVELFYGAWTDATTFVDSYTFNRSTIEGQRVKFTVCYQCATVPASANSDGSISVQMTIGSAAPITVYDLTGISLFVSLTADNTLRGFQFGAGIVGDLVSVSVNNTGCNLVDAPSPIDNGTRCCNAVDGSSTGVTGGIPPGVDPYAPLPPSDNQCDGLGTVPTASDPTAGETWNT